MMDAFLILDEDAYVPYVNDFYDAHVTGQGKVNGVGASDNYCRANELESIAPSRARFDLSRNGSIEPSESNNIAR